jgi:hypothetical protein
VRIRFLYDPDGEPHFYAHGVTEEEVGQALGRRGEDRPGRRGSRVAVGHTWGGRILRVVYRVLPDGTLFVITAFELRGKPLTAYRRRRRGGR